MVDVMSSVALSWYSAVLHSFARHVDGFGPETFDLVCGTIRRDDAFAKSMSVTAWAEFCDWAVSDWSLLREVMWVMAPALCRCGCLRNTRCSSLQSRKRCRSRESEGREAQSPCSSCPRVCAALVDSYQQGRFSVVKTALHKNGSTASECGLELCRWLYGALRGTIDSYAQTRG